jgi:hypothetical protein
MLNGLTLKEGGTTATSGGTDMTYQVSGKTVTNGIAIVNVADPNILTREEIVCVSRMAAKPAGNAVYTKQKGKLQFSIPYTDDNGNAHYSIVRVEIEVSPEQLAADSTLVDKLREFGAQLLKNAGTDGFWDVGSLN